MRLFVLGGTGKTGTALLEQALALGHEVTAFGRSAVRREGKSLQVILGNPMDEKELAAAMPGHDVVLSALGSRGLGAPSVVSGGARATVEAARVAGLRRLLIVSSTLLDADAGWFTRVMGRTLLRHVVADQRAMEELVTRSVMDWTVIRAARLTNGALTRKYVVSAQPAGPGFSGRAMSREDLACMMLDEAERSKAIKQTVRVCGGGS
jgi:putative NADH-flavin reductase